MSWSDHLCKARIELHEGPGDDRERLANAAREFARALAARREWPMDVKAMAGSLRAKLTATGRVDETIAAMDEQALREVSDRLWRFCEIAEPCPWEGPAAEVRGIEHLRLQLTGEIPGRLAAHRGVQREDQPAAAGARARGPRLGLGEKGGDLAPDPTGALRSGRFAAGSDL